MIPRFLPLALVALSPLAFCAPTPEGIPLIASSTVDPDSSPSNTTFSFNSTMNTTFPAPLSDVPLIPTVLPQLSSQEGQPVLNWTRVSSTSNGIEHVEVLNQQGEVLSQYDQSSTQAQQTGSAQNQSGPSRLVPIGTVPFLPTWRQQDVK
ncbi:MAG: hypothetical protein M1814_004545 [Vezdaea aestivalis]|nr:MAG: hypothetical protein M1814_004545 [Vezdaea aestivalis]